MNRKSVLLFCFFILFFLVSCGRKEDEKVQYMVLIGEDSGIVEKVSNVEVLVIDAAYFSREDIEKLKASQVEHIYTYLNIGSIENFRSYYDEFEKYTLGEYENWPQEKWVDVSEKEWQNFISKQCDELEQKGIDGFFVDNVDVYYVYPREEIYDGIVDILSDIKNRNKPVYINGGDTFVNKYLESMEGGELFDGVNQEGVYTTYDFHNNSFKESPKEDRDYYTQYLKGLSEKGYEVYVLEYATEPDMKKKACLYSKELKYICYVSDNIELFMNQ